MCTSIIKCADPRAFSARARRARSPSAPTTGVLSARADDARSPRAHRRRRRATAQVTPHGHHTEVSIDVYDTSNGSGGLSGLKPGSAAPRIATLARRIRRRSLDADRTRLRNSESRAMFSRSRSRGAPAEGTRCLFPNTRYSAWYIQQGTFTYE